MIKSNLKQCLFIGLLAFSPYNKNLSGSNYVLDIVPEIKLETMVVKAKRTHTHSSISEFLGFKLQTRYLNTNVSDKLKEVLMSYTGPKVEISSLRRSGTKSKHCCGKAVDLEWNKDLIDYLVSSEGTAWREKWNLTFFIEAKPHSSCLLPYKKDEKYSKYVFENPNATGPHIHLNLK